MKGLLSVPKSVDMAQEVLSLLAQDAIYISVDMEDFRDDRLDLSPPRLVLGALEGQPSLVGQPVPPSFGVDNVLLQSFPSS